MSPVSEITCRAPFAGLLEADTNGVTPSSERPSKENSASDQSFAESLWFHSNCGPSSHSRPVFARPLGTASARRSIRTQRQPLSNGDHERVNVVHLLGFWPNGTEIGRTIVRRHGKVGFLPYMVPQHHKPVLETGRLEPAHIFAVLP